jgi:hypothetical protein
MVVLNYSERALSFDPMSPGKDGKHKLTAPPFPRDTRGFGSNEVSLPCSDRTLTYAHKLYLARFTFASGIGRCRTDSIHKKFLTIFARKGINHIKQLHMGIMRLSVRRSGSSSVVFSGSAPGSKQMIVAYREQS